MRVKDIVKVTQKSRSAKVRDVLQHFAHRGKKTPRSVAKLVINLLGMKEPLSVQNLLGL